MLYFPKKHYSSAGEYLDQYVAELTTAYKSIERHQLNRAVMIIKSALASDATIFCCGNGGSAAIANHMVCDHQKGVNADTHFRPKVVSLSSNVEMITAVSNDIGYSDVFAFPLRMHGRSGDILIAISSSGNSENIVRAIEAATEKGMETISMTGFDGGRSRNMSNAAIHVDAHNYGVVEDAHQSCMHILAQFIRHQVMPLELVSERSF